MRALETASLRWIEVPTPQPGPGELRIRVRAAGCNRADLLQRSGKYPAPAGESDLLGLEVSGTVEEVGPEVQEFKSGDRVCALLAGGGYAEQVVAPAGQCFPLPKGFSWEQGAAVPEVFTTAWLNLFREGALSLGESCLVHAGGSGVGTAAIALCNARGNPIAVTVGSSSKAEKCVALGADRAWLRTDDWATLTKAWCSNGVSVILDPVGGSTLAANQSALAIGGRLVAIGLMGGRTAEIDLGKWLMNRQRWIGSVLRSRTRSEKAAIVADVREHVWPLFEQGLRPTLDGILSMEQAAEAHALLASNGTFGKVVLTFG